MIRFFGDAEYSFKLTNPLVRELERTTGTGIGALYRKMISSQFHLAEITETIRLALIGGGTNPEAAKALSDTYSTTPSLVHGLALAFDVLELFYTGPADQAADTQEPLKND